MRIARRRACQRLKAWQWFNLPIKNNFVRVKIARPHSTMRLCALITSGGTFQSVTQEDPVDTPLEEPLIYFRSSRSIHSPPSTRIDRLTSDPLLLSQHTVLKDFEAQDSRARGTYATFLPRQNPTTLAISSVVPTLFCNGVFLFCLSTTSLDILSSISDSTGPGLTALTVVPLPPNSAAQHLFNPSIAALLEQYKERLGKSQRAPTELMFMMRPLGARNGRTACVISTVPRTLRSYTEAKSSSVISPRGFTSSTPALLTKIFTFAGPRSGNVCSIHRFAACMTMLGTSAFLRLPAMERVCGRLGSSRILRRTSWARASLFLLEWRSIIC
jgi:hypothetical protein